MKAIVISINIIKGSRFPDRLWDTAIIITTDPGKYRFIAGIASIKAAQKAIVYP
jgi:hypothetical protein